MNMCPYFFSSLGIFAYNTIILTIFGWGILQLIYRKEKFPLFSAAHLLLSYGLGLIFMVVYATIIILISHFSVYTITLPILAVDCVILGFNASRISKSLHVFFSKESYGPRRKIYSKYGGLLIVLILQVAFQLQFQMAYLSLSTWDPYGWFEYNILLHKDAVLIDKSIPLGFVILCNFYISMLSDFYLIYFFLKFLPIFEFSVGLTVAYMISDRIFKGGLTNLVFLLFTMTIPYLNYRYSLLLPTHICNIFVLLIGLLSLLPPLEPPSSLSPSTHPVKHILWNKNQVKKVAIREYNLLLGFFLGGIGLFHPLYYLLFVLCYFSYEILLGLRLMFRGFHKNLEELRSIFLKLVIIFISHVLIILFYLALTHMLLDLNELLKLYLLNVVE